VRITIREARVCARELRAGQDRVDGGAPAWRISEPALHWCKLYQDGSLSAVSAGEEEVPASELSNALKQVGELQRLLGKRTMEMRFCATRA